MSKVLIIFALLYSQYTQGDKFINDPKAKLLLEAVSKTYKSYPAIDSKFSLLTESPQGKTTTQSGQVLLKGEKYKLIMGNQEIYCDKSSVWTYLKDINEVQINDYEPNQGEVTPSNMFSIYQTDFNYMLNGEETINNCICKIVDLKPKDTSRSYFKVRIWVDKTNNVKRIKIFDKNGSRYTYSVVTFNSKAVLEDAEFKFDASQHPGVHVEDLRM
jgi:outer membrane lipoprotein carrier protein